MKRKNTNDTGTNLRQKAEEIYKSHSLSPKNNLSETEEKQLIHELEVHQIELEMQNSELLKANEQIFLKEQRIEEANKKFI